MHHLAIAMESTGCEIWKMYSDSYECRYTDEIITIHHHNAKVATPMTEGGCMSSLGSKEYPPFAHRTIEKWSCFRCSVRS